MIKTDNRGVELLHQDTLRKLNFPLWKKQFESKIGLVENPFFAKFYNEKYKELSEPRDEDLSPDDRWSRIVAVLSMAYDQFDIIDVPLPQQWRMKKHPYTAKTFNLKDLGSSKFPWGQVHKWCSMFDEFEAGKMPWLEEGDTGEIWWLRKQLLDEFVGSFFDRIKKFLSEKGVKRNKELRDLLAEAAFYRKSHALSNAFYGKVETFIAGIKEDKADPMVRFVKETLPAIFEEEEDKIDRKSIVLDMLEGYWQQLKTSKKPAELVDLISAEVRELVDFITLEMD